MRLLLARLIRRRRSVPEGVVMSTAASLGIPQPPALPAWRFTPVTEGTRALADVLWRDSQDADDTLFRPPGGWWPLTGWAHASALLWRGPLPVGVVGLAPAAFAGRAEARIALRPVTRTPSAARFAVDVARYVAHELGYEELTLTLPGAAEWVQRAATESGFSPSHAFHVLERPASRPLRHVTRGLELDVAGPQNVDEVLAALNAAYEATPDYEPIARETLAAELMEPEGKFLIARGDIGQIIATAHVRFSRTAPNPSGGSYAWVSNLTVSPRAQGQGLGRATLDVAIAELGEMGATAVALGVDSRNVPAIRLYESEGFEPVGQLGFWTHGLR